MKNTKSCNICRNLYEKRKSPSIRVVRKVHHNGKLTLYIYDLCPNCQKELESFVNKKKFPIQGFWRKNKINDTLKCDSCKRIYTRSRLPEIRIVKYINKFLCNTITYNLNLCDDCQKKLETFLHKNEFIEGDKVVVTFPGSPNYCCIGIIELLSDDGKYKVVFDHKDILNLSICEDNYEFLDASEIKRID